MSSSRTRPVRAKVVRLLLIPLLSLTILWGYAASVIGENALRSRHWSGQAQELVSVREQLEQVLIKERTVSVVFASAPTIPRAQLDAARAATDPLLKRFRPLALRYERPYGLTEDFDHRLERLIQQLDRIPEIRAAVDRRDGGRLQALDGFTPVFEAFHSLNDAWVASDDREIIQFSYGIVAGSRGSELLSREHALVMAAFLAGGTLTPDEHRAFTSLVTQQRQWWTYQRSLMPRREYARYMRPLFSSAAYQQFRQMEDRIAATESGPLPVGNADWEAAALPMMQGQAEALIRAGAAIGERGDRFGDQKLLQLGLAGGGGLLALVLSLLLSARFGRSMVRELVGLRDTARRLAEERLPDVVHKLSRGHQVDTRAETPVLGRRATREVAEVVNAFSAVQHTAVQAAVGQARLREGTRAVFLNIARRNQSLLHRQLSMLDALESRAEPDDLEELFALDHLTTRMRRHAESLIILSGATPGRGWRRPVRIIDVVRGAVAEVEQYTRVSVVRASEDALVGAVVTDVIHLVAELVENATVFSPPHTEVTVLADRVGTGYVIEVEDRGLGLPGPELDVINRRLAGPPEFDLADSDRLGLFVVARLAVRHGIGVSLRRSPFGGTTAIVLIPAALIVNETELDPPPERTSQGAFVQAERQDHPVHPQAVAPAENGAHARVAPAPVPEAGTHAGLPRRVRQKNLAPQLQDQAQQPASTAQPISAQGPRSPEEARSLASALQYGWQRGRTTPPQADGTVFDVSNVSRYDGPVNHGDER